MQIEIEARNFPLTQVLHSHAERQLRSALTCCGDHIRRVAVRLSDVNGPRGGADKRCRLQMVLAGLPDVVVEDVEADLYVACLSGCPLRHEYAFRCNRCNRGFWPMAAFDYVR
jgi:hypothetical protein